MSIVVRDARFDPSAQERAAGPAAAPFLAIQRAVQDSRTGSPLLRRSLRLADATALVVAWTLATLILPAPSPGIPSQLLVSTLLMVAVGCWLISKHELYLARVATMRTVEQAGLARVCVLLTGASAAFDYVRGVDVSAGRAALGGIASFVALSIARTAYRGWLTAARRKGRFIRPVVIVGIDDQTAELCRVMSDHAELGFEPVGVLGTREAAERAELGGLWLGEVDEVLSVVRDAGLTGAIVSSTALEPGTLNAVTRALHERGCHVHLSTGMRSIDQRRMRPMHLGYEPLLYLEPLSLTDGQRLAKRALDISVSLLVGLFVAPILLVSAAAIKLHDGGPVLFRQRRVGRGGEHFTMVKLRTMSVGAEDLVDELRVYNERNGPLFKMKDDPRVTRVGRVLRGLSIDELPQLWNVLRGDMSLVGPRPALPCEARSFGPRLQARTNVLPGVTGLWQVEAVESASLHTYERLDLYYVENWSVGLDVMVIIATIEEELIKLARQVVPSGGTQRRSRALLRLSALGPIALGIALMLGACSDDDEPLAGEVRTAGTDPVAAEGSDDAEPPAGAEPGTDVAEPVPLSGTADFGDGVTATVSAIEPVTAEASLPGEVGGPGVAITVEITNGSAGAVDLDAVTVDLTDASGASATPITPPEPEELSGSVAPGESAQGRYVFSLPTDDRAGATLRVSYSADAPSVLFTGDLPDA